MRTSYNGDDVDADDDNNDNDGDDDDNDDDENDVAYDDNYDDNDNEGLRWSVGQTALSTAGTVLLPTSSLKNL